MRGGEAVVNIEAQLDGISSGLDRFAATLAPAARGGSLPADFEAERAGFAALLAEHFAVKEMLYERLRVAGGHELEPLLRRSRAAMLALVVAYRCHRREWRSGAVAADPAGYAAAAIALLDDARGVVARDRRSLLPVVRRLALTTAG
jgi:hypothetical protein